MAIEGDLKDASLINLVQFICHDGRNTALFLTRQREDGVIYFEGGEPIHATTGLLDGDEAVYQLLKWTEGTFRVTNCETIPRRTITSSWNHLILEGMRRLDEGASGAGGKAETYRVLTQTEIEQDSCLENSLISLLSNLEHLRAQLDDKRSRKQPASVLKTLTEIVNQVITFGEEHLHVDYLSEALTFVVDRNPDAQLLKVEDNRLSGEIAVLYAQWKGDRPGRGEAFHQAGLGMINVLETLLTFITNSFRSSSMADQWRLTCIDFMADLMQAVAKVQF